MTHETTDTPDRIYRPSLIRDIYHANRRWRDVRHRPETRARTRSHAGAQTAQNGHDTNQSA